MSFSIVIPTCNRNDLLSKCLDMLLPDVQLTNVNYEVIVTDDSKNEGAKQLIKEKYKWAKWVAGPQKGPAANRNSGAKKAVGEWLIYIDDDCLPDKNMINAYQQALKNNEGIRVFEGCIKADREQRDFNEEAPINDTGGHLWSCNFMINKKTFTETLNGFDEKFPFAAMEDVDLDYRLKINNIKVLFLPDAFVIHPWRLQKRVYTITIQRFKSTIYFLNKHPELKQQINSKYFLVAFYHFSIDVWRNMFKFRFRGVGKKVATNFLQLYFAMYLVFDKGD